MVPARLAAAVIAVGGERRDFDAIAAALKARRMGAFGVF
jgi:hypothetical protein